MLKLKQITRISGGFEWRDWRLEGVENMLGRKERSGRKNTLRNKRCYNILLLGESGTGKSTTINALANYVRFESFDDAAQANDFTQLIPCKFTLPDPHTGKPLVIEYGCQDSNERTSGPQGHSSTQSPRGYEFILDDQQDPIRLIDTPGIGDTGGTDLDKRNFDKIFSYLQDEIDQLHAVLILMKSTDTKQNVFFRYCITELLTHLHKSACSNIVFCFTFSRNSCYRPGDAFAALSNFLREELRDVPLTLRPKVNCFFIDNEAFRFLVAQKSGYPFSENQAAAYRESWNQSAQQVASMMSHIVRLPAHDLRQTISLNRARVILNLAEPMARLQGNINRKIQQLDQEELRLKTSKLSVEELANTLHLEVDVLEATPLDSPTLVCTSDRCTDVIQFEGQTKINYRTKCHIDCQLTNVETGLVGNWRIWFSKSMNLFGICVRSGKTVPGRFFGKYFEPTDIGCGCRWDKHMLIKVEYNIVKRTIVDRKKKREIESKQEAIDCISKFRDELRTLVAQYRREFDTISDVCSQFAWVLIEHSCTPYNRYFEPYLQLLIDEERRKCASVPGYSRVALDGLQRMLEAHRSKVEILSKAIENKTSKPILLSEVEHLGQSLFDLPHHGAQLRQMMNSMNDPDDDRNQNQDDDLRRRSAATMVVVPYTNVGRPHDETNHKNSKDKNQKNYFQKTIKFFKNIF